MRYSCVHLITETGSHEKFDLARITNRAFDSATTRFFQAHLKRRHERNHIRVCIEMGPHLALEMKYRVSIWRNMIL
jgi:hypothetical protein